MLKTMIKILGIIFVVGLVFITIAWSLGGNKSISSNKKEIVSEIQKNIDEFDCIKVDTIDCDVMITEGDDYGFEAQNAYGAKFNWSVENGVLTLGEEKKTGFNVDMNFYESEENYIKIFVPKETALEYVNADITSGDADVTKIKAKNIKLELTSGDIKITDCQADDIQIKATSGEVDIQNSIVKNSNLDLVSGGAQYDNVKTENIEMKSTSGDFEITGEVANSVNVDLVSGDATLNLKGKEEDYSFELKSISSDITIGNSNFEDKVSIQKGSKQIKIDCTSGGIEVKFL